MVGDDGVPGLLDGRSSTLFLAAGALMVAFAANTGLETFTGTSYPIVQNTVGPAGFLLGVLGLLGLYPVLADRTPTLARVAAAVALVPAAGWSIIVVGSVGETAGLLPGLAGPLAVIPILAIGGTVLTYTLFGVTTLRAGVYPSVLGVLMLVPAAMFAMLLSGVGTAFIVDVGHVVGHLGVGIVLWTAGVPTDTAGPATGATP